MLNKFYTAILLCLGLALGHVLHADDNHGHILENHDVVYQNFYTYETVTSTAAIYGTIYNKGTTDIIVTGVLSHDCRMELHKTSKEDGVYRMRPIDQIIVPAGESVKLEPGGLHIMAMGLTSPLKKDGKNKLHFRLLFDSSGKKYEMDLIATVWSRINNTSNDDDGCNCGHKKSAAGSAQSATGR